MHILTVSGGHPLKGEVSVSGAKNSVTKLLVASLISKKRSIFFNVPNIEEVKITLELCQSVGMIATWDKDNGVIECITPEITSSEVPQTFSGANRIPILLLGTLLGRVRTQVSIPTMGGCYLGSRPVDFHLEAMQKFGATVQMHQEGPYLFYRAIAPQGLTGAVIELPFPSVGATENALFAAAQAQGTTLIKNCAIEPELIDIVLFLQKIGVQITVGTDRTIRVLGTKEFHQAEHEVIFDRVETASLAAAAIATKGHVFLRKAKQEALVTFLNKLMQIGGGFYVRKDGIEFFYQKPLVGGLHLETGVHPGFLTDWQPQFVTLLTQATGSSIVHETIFDHRFGYVPTLCQMGANLELFQTCLGTPCRFDGREHHHSLVVTGKTALQPAQMTIPDLRGGFAYLMAALIAEGTSEISNLHFLDRGYEAIDCKLAQLGAILQRGPKPCFVS